jgi:asparagine synthase (glutamine-hydrolysing)
MCGICGFTGPINNEHLIGMVGTLEHRGPDDIGIWNDGSAISLGMRRLAIVDIFSGQQPVFNRDRTIAAVFNGEIYNHKKLREFLISKGYIFQSNHSDSEVIVHLFEEKGEDFLCYLNGMFAIAIWDSRDKSLLLARDRIGIKPLYYAEEDGRVIFSSEIKAILKNPSIVGKINYRAIEKYFSFKNTLAPETIYSNIYQLKPAEKIKFKDGEKVKSIWWKVSYKEDYEIDEVTAANEIRRLLAESVKLQTNCEVPYGAFLSGGLDSSSVVAMMSESSSSKIKTFSLIYENEIEHKSGDRDSARLISKMYDTEHYEYVLSSKEVVDSIGPVLSSFDEPFSGVTSTFFLTKLISKHVKVALSGNGADELFGSYLAHRLASPLAKLDLSETSETDIDRKFIEDLDINFDFFKSIYKVKGEANRRAALLLNSTINRKKLLSKKLLTKIKNNYLSNEEILRNFYELSNTSDPINRALYVDICSLLPDQILTFEDRLSMAHSVEVRPPFLDHKLVEFSATIPGALKIKNGEVKSILKKAMVDVLPSQIINRKKEGFVLPIDKWISTELRDFVEETLSPQRLRIHGLLEEGVVRELIDEHYKKNINHGPRIWNLIIFQHWWESIVRNPKIQI